MKGIYAILDEKNFNFDYLENHVKKMISFKIKIFQIRIKSDFNKKIISTILKIQKLCTLYNCTLILNDNVELVKDLKLDGVHIGKNDKDLIDCRNFLGDKKIIGVSCYSNFDRAITATKYNASYVSFGSLYNTSTKSDATKLDISVFHKAKSILNIPICLIGGINENNILEVIKLNSDLIAISNGLSSNIKVKNITSVYYEKK
jgi:thiamine-phosphate pyrophosphorylase